jgi:hypothetical protein
MISIWLVDGDLQLIRRSSFAFVKFMKLSVGIRSTDTFATQNPKYSLTKLFGMSLPLISSRSRNASMSPAITRVQSRAPIKNSG